MPVGAVSGFVSFEFLHADLEQVKMIIFSKYKTINNNNKNPAHTVSILEWEFQKRTYWNHLLNSMINTQIFSKSCIKGYLFQIWRLSSILKSKSNPTLSRRNFVSLFLSNKTVSLFFVILALSFNEDTILYLNLIMKYLSNADSSIFCSNSYHDTLFLILSYNSFSIH